MDESYIHSSHTHHKSWSDDSNEGVLQPLSKGQRLIIVHAGGAMGFIPNAMLLFRSNTKSGDYHAEMNFENYKKWLTEKLIPNLPKESVLVIDNAPYHNVQVDKAPTSASRKDDMRKWLSDKNIAWNDAMLKPELYNLIKLYKPRYKTYQIDSLLRDKGHSVLRLPPYHPDLNPIELVWAAMKQFVADRNVNFSVTRVEALCIEFFEQFTVDEWVSRCNHAKKYEQEYMDNEPALDLVLDNLIINVGVNSDSDSDSDELSGSDTDSATE